MCFITIRLNCYVCICVFLFIKKKWETILLLLLLAFHCIRYMIMFFFFGEGFFGFGLHECCCAVTLIVPTTTTTKMWLKLRYIARMLLILHFTLFAQWFWCLNACVVFWFFRSRIFRLYIHKKNIISHATIQMRNKNLEIWG